MFIVAYRDPKSQNFAADDENINTEVGGHFGIFGTVTKLGLNKSLTPLTRPCAHFVSWKLMFVPPPGAQHIAAGQSSLQHASGAESVLQCSQDCQSSAQ